MIENKIFFIAEAWVNHNGDIQLAYKLIDEAKNAWADAVKFQTFKSENLVVSSADMASYQKKNLWTNETQLNMLKKLELSYDDFSLLKEYCDKIWIMFLSTPHSSFEDIDFLDNLWVQYFKFGSWDLDNIPFIRHAAKTHKPIILWTWMSYLKEVEFAVNTIKAESNADIYVLHATTNYPCPFNEVNLLSMKTMMEQLDCFVWYSDHTIWWEVPVLAALHGAKVIEKHFTLDNDMAWPDHKASADTKLLKEVISKIRDVESWKLTLASVKLALWEEYDVIMWSSEKKPNDSELKTMITVKKSIYLSKDIKNWSTLSGDDLVIKRPYWWISPMFYFDLIGKTVNKDLKKDYQITTQDYD